MIPKRVYAKINLDNIQKNIQSIKSKFSNKVAVMGIVKANAYGHGAVEVAKAMCDAGVNYFGVAAIDEAIELRQNDISLPILILGQIFKQDFCTAIENDITCTIVDIDTAKRLSAVAVSMNKKVKIHIKIDTGMGRIGFQPDDDGYNQVKEIFTLDGLLVEGIFTHFACADSIDKTSAYNQKQKFLQFCQKLKEIGYAVKLDTNGTNPTLVKTLAENGLVDHFAVDIKNDKENYAKIIGFDKFDTKIVEKTVDYLLTGKVSYEFRTTLIKE